jgi:hypothetical protein
MDTGYKSPSSNGAKGIRNVWTNPVNAYLSNNSYASRADDGTSDQDHSFETFGFTIPAGAIIDGIEVRIEAKASQNVTLYINVHSNSGGGWVGTKSINLTTTEVIQVVGGITDKWYGSWIVDDFTNANFSVRVYTYLWPGTGEVYEMDHIEVRVHYTLAGKHKIIIY